MTQGELPGTTPSLSYKHSNLFLDFSMSFLIATEYSMPLAIPASSGVVRRGADKAMQGLKKPVSRGPPTTKDEDLRLLDFLTRMTI